MLDAQLVTHPHLPVSAAGLQRVGGRLDGTGLLRLEEETVVFGFSKHRGKPLVEVALTDPDYCHWMLATASRTTPASSSGSHSARPNGRPRGSSRS